MIKKLFQIAIFFAVSTPSFATPFAFDSFEFSGGAVSTSINGGFEVVQGGNFLNLTLAEELALGNSLGGGFRLGSTAEILSFLTAGGAQQTDFTQAVGLDSDPNFININEALFAFEAFDRGESFRRLVQQEFITSDATFNEAFADCPSCVSTLLIDNFADFNADTVVFETRRVIAIVDSVDNEASVVFLREAEPTVGAILEPTSIALLSLGLLGVVGVSRKRSRVVPKKTI